MSGKRDGGRRGPSATDLMATRPGANAAALEAVRREVARLGDAVAARDAAEADRPVPLTRQDLDDWGADFLERVAEAAAEGPGPVTREELDNWGVRLLEGFADDAGIRSGPESPQARTAAQAGRMEAAADRIEGATMAEGERLAALEGRLTADREAILDATVRTRDVVRGSSVLLGDVQSEVSALGTRMDGTRLRWWMSVLPWTLLGILAGMALEGRLHFAFNLYRWFGI